MTSNQLGIRLTAQNMDLYKMFTLTILCPLARVSIIFEDFMSLQHRNNT